MKILFVQPYISFNGVLSDTLPGQLAKNGHDIIIASYVRPGYPVDFQIEKLKIYPMRSLSFSFYHLITEFPMFLHFNDVIRELSPDIIHANNLPFFTTYQSMKAAKKYKIPGILQVHGLTAERGFLLNTFQSLYLKMLGAQIFNASSNVICLTKINSIQLQKYGCPLSKLTIVPNGVDTKKFRPNLTAEQTGLIVWIGRFVFEKGLEFLIEAINVLTKTGQTNFKLLLIGDGPEKGRIQSQIQFCHLESVITLSPGVSHDEVLEFLQRASIFVIPSLKEGMPYVLLEAMACGKAVIGSNISGINSIITSGVNGLLVTERNPNLLANALSALLNDPSLRTQLGKNARDLMVKKYDWTKLVQKIEKIYVSANQSLTSPP